MRLKQEIDLSTKDFSLSIKALSDDGSFEGYGSIFGNVDAYGERVMPGAFIKSLQKHQREGTKVAMLWSHQSDQPIGVWSDLAEDAKGLWGKGHLLTEVQRAKEIHVLMKAKAVSGLSIGYREVTTTKDGDVLNLDELDLREISPVVFPANRRARVNTVKSEQMLAEFAKKLIAGNPPPIKEFEDVLREAGIPKSMATAIASHGYAKAIRSESEGEAQKKLTAMREALAAFTRKD
jgi:HK97 family phage prohead protease